MVVDDSELVRELVTIMLESRGFIVVTLDNQFEFAQLLTRERPDLVLMDVDMPGLQGDAVVQIIRDFELHRCPIVLHSDRSASDGTLSTSTTRLPAAARLLPLPAAARLLPLPAAARLLPVWRWL